MNNKILSVIVPIYNVESYLEEALDSIVNQDIGFNDNIQLILVNDGSPDNSETICLKYKDRYPSITYIHQHNQGVSAARNKGMEVASGKYVAFFDPDDKLSLDAYRLTIEFFELHYDEIDLAAFKMKFFERYTGDHPLNYRFKDGSRVVDVTELPTYMQSSGVSCVYKASALQGKYFDGSIKFAEDMKLINEVILEKKKYGVVDGPVYYVRKRMNENSASNTGHLNPEYYTITPVKVFKYLFDLWEKTNGHLDEFIQFVVLFDLQFRINQPSQIALSDKQEMEYKKNISELVKRVTNDELIIGMPKMKIAYKLYLLKQKYGKESFNELVRIKNSQVVFNDIEIPGVLPGVGIDRITSLTDGRVRIEGYISGLIVDKAKYWAETSSGKAQIKKNKYRNVSSRNVFLGEQVDLNEAFYVDLSIRDYDEISFHYSPGIGSAKLGIKTSYVSGLGDIDGAYAINQNKLIEKSKESIKVKPYTASAAVLAEVKFLVRILFRLKLKVAFNELQISLHRRLKQELSTRTKLMSILRPFLIPAKALAMNILTILLRILARPTKKLKQRQIWLISDRISSASDNGEALYRYLQDAQLEHNYYFAINKDSKAYYRLKEQGFRVVDMLSIKYKFLILIADRVISSNADDLIFNPFLEEWSRYVDLMSFKFVFLQHGVTKDDLSRQYNRWNSKFDMLVTSTQQEYNSIVKNKYYGFTEDVVKLTGFPRFDYLEDTSINKVALLPTWRKGLDGGLDKRTGLRKYSEDFIETDYFKFYNALINDNRLKALFEEKGLIGEFYLHPSFSAQAVDFRSNGCFEVKTMPYDFRKIFSESCILITDYSSAAFDFAYLKKPVFYIQFDKDSFFKSHTYQEGYYSYTRDGFGPVSVSREELVDEIIKCANNQLKMQKKYTKRVEGAFKYTDRSNSERVCEAIVSLDK